MHCLTMKTHPKKCVLQCFTHCENLIKWTSKEATRSDSNKTANH